MACLLTTQNVRINKRFCICETPKHCKELHEMSIKEGHDPELRLDKYNKSPFMAR